MRYLFFSNQTWQEPAEFSHELLPLLQRERRKAFPMRCNSALANCSLNHFSRESSTASSLRPSSVSFMKDSWKPSSEAAMNASWKPSPEASMNASWKPPSEASMNASWKSSPEAAPLTISAVGAGGKTSLLMQLMKECIQSGLQVMVTTTTHMFLPEAELISPPLEGPEPWDQRSQSSRPGRIPVFLGTPVTPPVGQDGWIKCSAPDPNLFWTLYPKMDVVLIEADGSKGLPAKIPAPWEPVIPDCTDLILAVYGLSSLGKPLGECCHRWELLKEPFPFPDSRSDDLHQEALASRQITPQLLGSLMKKYYLDPFDQKYGYPSVIPVWNQADTQALTAAGKTAAACCGASLQLITAF